MKFLFQAPKKARKQTSKNVNKVKPPETTMLLTDLPNEILVSIAIPMFMKNAQVIGQNYWFPFI